MYLLTPDEVWGRIHYIDGNPVKEGLGAQTYAFVVPYDNWPFHHTTR